MLIRLWRSNLLISKSLILSHSLRSQPKKSKAIQMPKFVVSKHPVCSKKQAISTSISCISRSRPVHTFRSINPKLGNMGKMGL